jgi:rifampin ADP-ribosylating transferase
MRYFHGGYGNLKVGQFVLPPSVTKAPSLARFGMMGICDTSKVYICTEFEGALIYGCMHHSGAGKVYEVEPVGDLAEDQDAKSTGFSFTCDKAKVVKVYRLKGKTIKRVQKFMIEDDAMLIARQSATTVPQGGKSE